MALTAFTGSYHNAAPDQQWFGPAVSYSIYSFLSPDDPAAHLGTGKIGVSGDSPESFSKCSKSEATRYRKNSKSLTCCDTNNSGSTWRRGQRRSDGSISLRRREQNRRAQSRFRAKRRASRSQASGKVPFPKTEQPTSAESKVQSFKTSSPTAISAANIPLSSSAPVDATTRRASFELSPLRTSAQTVIPPPQAVPLSSSWPSLSPPIPAVELSSTSFMSPLCPSLPGQSTYSQAVLAPAIPVLPPFSGPASSPPLSCGMPPPPPPPAPGASVGPALAPTLAPSPASLKNHFTVDMLYPGPWFPSQWEENR